MHTDLRVKALQLRRERRLSLKDIHRETGVAQSTLSRWLAGDPLSKEEQNRSRIRRAKENPVTRHAEPVRGVPIQSLVARKLTRHDKGKIAEAAVLLRLCVLGLESYGSVFDGDKIDWVAARDGKLLKIQVRWARTSKRGGRPSVSVTRAVGTPGRSKTTRYADGEIDFLVGYDLDADCCHVWSWEEVRHYTAAVAVSASSAEAWHKLLEFEG